MTTDDKDAQHIEGFIVPSTGPDKDGDEFDLDRYADEGAPEVDDDPQA
jgi:hypothetical protein